MKTKKNSMRSLTLAFSLVLAFAGVAGCTAEQRNAAMDTLKTEGPKAFEKVLSNPTPAGAVGAGLDLVYKVALAVAGAGVASTGAIAGHRKYKRHKAKKAADAQNGE